MNKHVLNFLKFIVFLGVGVGIMYFVYSKYSEAYLADCGLKGISEEACGTLFQKVVKDFKTVNFFWIFMVLVAFTISNASRALRWNMLIKPLGYSPRLVNSFFCIIIGYFANMFLPRVGEVARAAMMSKYEKIPAEKLFGTIVVGRVVDVLCLLLAIGLTILFEFDSIMNFLSANSGDDAGGGGSFFSSPIFYALLLMAGVLVLAIAFRKQLMETKLVKKVIDILKGLWEGIQTVGKLERPLVFIFHSLNIWVMYFFMTYLCFFAFAPTSGLPPVAALMAFVFGAFGIVIPSPGGMGTYHFFTTEALKIYNVPEGDAFSFANILFFSIQLGCNIVIGLLAVILLPWVNRNYEPKPRLGD